jgi:flavin-binding protein dodecin
MTDGAPPTGRRSATAQTLLQMDRRLIDRSGNCRCRSSEPTPKGKAMTVARITEISSVSGVSFQDAIVQGVERANKTLKNVKGAWVKDQEVTIDKGKISGYKVILKVTFILSD